MFLCFVLYTCNQLARRDKLEYEVVSMDIEIVTLLY